MVVGARQVGTQNQREPAGRALGGQAADLGLAPRAQVAFSARPAVASAQADVVLGGEDPAGEPHHEQAGVALLLDARDGRRRGGEQQVAEVLLVQRDVVAGIIAPVGLGAELRADGDLSRQSDDRDADAICDQAAHRVVYVAGIAGQERSVDYENLARAVRRCMTVGGDDLSAPEEVEK